ncbi:unnamed protein product, partial [Mesorhabditis belari]|uniref:Tetraspanin n=1 Tax=Mesorhabditis belari TaxID=2138241 RepID=A0AAF3J1Y5_9BILA
MGVAYGVSCCTRSFLVLLNLAMMVVALAALALAIWIRCDDSFEESIQDMRTWITVSFWVIVGFCIACAIIGLAGLLGAASRSRVLVALYFVALLIVILLEIAVGIFVLVERHKVVRDAVKEYVQVSYQMQLRDVQTLEYRYDCCGVENFANPQCNPLLPTCSSAVWDRLDYTLMVFGCSMLAVIVCQVITALIALVLVGTPSRYADA